MVDIKEVAKKVIADEALPIPVTITRPFVL